MKKETKKPWYVYILLCKDGTYYTGITIDVQSRFAVHQSGKGAKYTRARGVVEIAYSLKCNNRNSAAVRELQIKKLSRTKKAELITTFSS